MYQTLVGKNVKRLMREQGICLDEVAKAMYLDSKKVAEMLENHEMISEHEIVAFAQVFQVEPNELFKE